MEILLLVAAHAGLPVPTTHALIGGLIGAGRGQGGGEVHYAKLAGTFLMLLPATPLLAAAPLVGAS